MICTNDLTFDLILGENKNYSCLTNLLTNLHDHIPISHVYYYPISNPIYYDQDNRLTNILFVTGIMLSTGMFRISISGKQFYNNQLLQSHTIYAGEILFSAIIE